MKNYLSLKLLLFLVFLTSMVNAKNIFVSTRGNNNNSGLTANLALRSIQQAINLAQPGDIILVEDGVYNEKLRFEGSNNSGTLDNYITLQANGDNVVLSGIGLAPEGREGLITVQDARYIKIKGLEIKDFQTSLESMTPIGVYVYGSSAYIEIMDNKIHDIKHLSTCIQGECGVGAHGIGVFGNTKQGITNIRLKNNEVYDNILQASEALVINGNVSSFIVEGNYVHDNNNIGFDFIGYEDYECDYCIEDCEECDSLNRARQGYVANNISENNSTISNPWYKFLPTAGGFYVDGGSYIIFDRNISIGNDIGFEFASERLGKSTDHIIMSNNLVYNNTQAGVAMGGYNNTSTGSAFDIYVINNTFYHNSPEGWGKEITFQYNVKNALFSNNIIVGNRSVGENIEGLAHSGNENIMFGTNLWWGNSTSGEGNLPGAKIIDNPLFINVGTDFSLSDNSNAINNGVDEGVINWSDDFWQNIYANGEIRLSGLTDLLDNDRNQNTIDLGAIEYNEIVNELPETPSNLVGIVNTESSIALNWEDNSDIESAFILERLIDNQLDDEINLEASTTSYTDNNLLENTTYTYRIRAYNEFGFSAYSNSITLKLNNTGNELPAPWQSVDIGEPGIAGVANYANGSFDISASGADIWGNSDEFHYVYQTFTGDGEIIVKMNSLTNTNPWAKAGLMIRENLSSGSKHAMIVTTAENGLAFQRRAKANESTIHTGIQDNSPWLKLTRLSDVITAYYATDGVNWSEIGQQILPMDNEIYIGMAVTSHDNTLECSASFNNVLIKDYNQVINIEIDGETQDWSSISPLSTDDSAGLNNLKAHHDSNNIYIAVEGKMDTNFIFFLNTDNNITTGYTNGLWSPQEGSDYSIENGNLYKYVGNGDNWSWEFLGTAGIDYVKNNSILELKFEKNIISGLASKIGIGLDIEDSGWNTVANIPALNTALAYLDLWAEKNKNGQDFELTSRAYPNPFQNELRIDVKLENPANSDVFITIYDMQGKQVDSVEDYLNNKRSFSYIWRPNNEINLPAGVYIVKVRIGKELRILKLVKTRNL